MSNRRVRLRKQYTSDVIAAFLDYVEHDGGFAFLAERGGSAPLAIRFVFDNAPLFDDLLQQRMAASDYLGGSVVQ